MGDKMKKIILCLLSILLLSGCGEKVFNTPVKKVETFLLNYQTLSIDVVEQLNKVVNEEENFNADQRLAYKELMKKHYQDLTYEIKDEKIDGDKATVTYKSKKYTYKIVKIYTQKKQGYVTIYRDVNKTTLTLITCTKNDNAKQTVYILERI